MLTRTEAGLQPGVANSGDSLFLKRELEEGERCRLGWGGVEKGGDERNGILTSGYLAHLVGCLGGAFPSLGQPASVELFSLCYPRRSSCGWGQCPTPTPYGSTQEP